MSIETAFVVFFVMGIVIGLSVGLGLGFWFGLMACNYLTRIFKNGVSE